MWSIRQAGYNGIFSFSALFFQPGDPHNNTYFTYRKQYLHFSHFRIFGSAVWDRTNGPSGPGTTVSGTFERPVGPGPAVLGAFDHFGRTRRQGPLETAVSGIRRKGYNDILGLWFRASPEEPCRNICIDILGCRDRGHSCKSL